MTLRMKADKLKILHGVFCEIFIYIYKIRNIYKNIRK